MSQGKLNQDSQDKKFYYYANFNRTLEILRSVLDYYNTKHAIVQPSRQS